MNNSSSANMEVVVNNLTELVNFNAGSVHELMSLSNNDHHHHHHQGFSSSADLDLDHDHHGHHHHHHHQRSQLPFSLINNDHIPTTVAVAHHHNHNHNIPMTYDSVAHFFPVGGGGGGGGGGPMSNGAGCSNNNNNNNNALSESDNCLMNSSPQGSGTGLLGSNNKTSANYNNHGAKKRKRNGEREAEKPREVVHVRAKRGQATDSHSLAERLRREKINEKLRCLQDLVPGCYKTMGMAVMLDVIINYVRSLQNQIDFLSMKLSAASLFYDFNSSDMDAMGTIHGMNGYEAQGMEKMMGEGYGVLPQFHPSNWPL